MRMTPRRWAVSVAAFVAIVIVGAWPREGVPSAFSKAYCPLANAGLALFVLGEGGRVHLRPRPDTARVSGDSVDADTLVVLSVDGFEGELGLGVSLRRDVYLPWLILVALLAVAPISTISRVASPLITAPIVLAASVGAYALLAAWIFSTRLQGVYTSSGIEPRVAALAQSALLTPPGNRFMAPIALGLCLILLDRDRRRRP